MEQKMQLKAINCIDKKRERERELCTRWTDGNLLNKKLEFTFEYS